VVVTYSVHPDAKAEHVRLIEGVFAQLAADRPDNIDYQVMCLADGVTFVHMSTADTPDGSNPIPDLAAFKEFSRDIAARVTSMPTPAAAEVVGGYHGRS
jgi:tRNA (Thr-GGU) A37 N-methylase